jgi:phosphatidyl-myo-inositol dimannoside synthase
VAPPSLPAAGLSVDAPVLLISELFPPFKGGSAVLFDNVYSRLGQIPVTVLTHLLPGSARDERRGNVHILRRPLAMSDWALFTREGLRAYARAVKLIRTSGVASCALLHCGRALPEGLQALFATWRRGRFLCWTHGEELIYARASTELMVLLRWVHRRAAAVVANSRHTAQMLTDLGVDPKKIHVVHPGVDAACFHPDLDGSAVRSRLAGANEILLLTVGRLQRRKGHDLVLRALALLRDQTPRIRYAILGQGEERPYLESLVQELGLHDVVTFATESEGADLRAYYAAADVFVMPNRIEGGDFEGFGIVFLEASACGLPTIGGRSGGVPEAVEEGHTGLLVGGENAQELADAIGRLARSSELRQQMGRAGRTRVIEHFTWERAAAKISALHHTLTRSS